MVPLRHSLLHAPLDSVGTERQYSLTLTGNTSRLQRQANVWEQCKMILKQGTIDFFLGLLLHQNREEKEGEGGNEE